jgi:hypothetical protein
MQVTKSYTLEINISDIFKPKNIFSPHLFWHG